MKDEDLVRRAKAGDKHSFEVLVKRHERKVYNSAYRILHNSDDAMDIMMETFYVAYTRLPSLKNEAKFGSWLIGIARNLALMRLRSKKKEISIEEPGVRKRLSVPFDDEVTREELRKIIKREIENLPHKYREAFVMREIMGFPYGRITKKLGISQSNAKVRVSRAKALLRTRLMKIL
ncbi:MAG: sigma-70 family RNA polymerase sigma factor [candidate division WOR-3 bacterium]|nr:sigma-70 family RNA polymerase sigma factor [candidate division WOR-3 bacterium]